MKFGDNTRTAGDIVHSDWLAELAKDSKAEPSWLEDFDAGFAYPQAKAQLDASVAAPEPIMALVPTPAAWPAEPRALALVPELEPAAAAPATRYVTSLSAMSLPVAAAPEPESLSDLFDQMHGFAQILSDMQGSDKATAILRLSTLTAQSEALGAAIVLAAREATESGLSTQFVASVLSGDKS